MTQIPADLVSGVVERVALSMSGPRPIGFRTITSDDEHGLVTGLAFHAADRRMNGNGSASVNINE